MFVRMESSIFSVLCGKCFEDVKDADVRELCGSAAPHPIRCPVCYMQLYTCAKCSARVTLRYVVLHYVTLCYVTFINTLVIHYASLSGR